MISPQVEYFVLNTGALNTLEAEVEDSGGGRIDSNNDTNSSTSSSTDSTTKIVATSNPMLPTSLENCATNNSSTNCSSSIDTSTILATSTSTTNCTGATPSSVSTSTTNCTGATSSSTSTSTTNCTGATSSSTTNCTGATNCTGGARSSSPTTMVETLAIKDGESTSFTSQPLLIIVTNVTELSLRKINLQYPPETTIGELIAEIGQRFKYESDSFALLLLCHKIEQVVNLEKLDSDRTLLQAGFNMEGLRRNEVTLTEIDGVPPKKIEEDDLSLGASASPTASTSDVKWMGSSCYGITPEYPYSSSSSSVLIKQDLGYVGLVNQAATCYLNSLIQTLFMTPEFRNALYNWEFTGNEDEALKNIPCQLQRLFLQLQTATKSAVETTSLTRSFGWDSSEAWQQHDIQELCRVMFDALEQCFKNTDQADFINTLYEGKMNDYVKCLECSIENAREDTYLDIPLPIRPFGSSTAFKSLEEALRAFVEPELLNDNNQYKCSKCDALTDAHKGLKFTKFPYLLTIHLKRFDFDYQTFHRIKLNDKVTFPTLLDLNMFINGELDKDDIFSSPSSTIITNGTAAAGVGVGVGVGVVTPDKPSVDKIDDASTSDSGSALDVEESSSVEYAASSTNQDLDHQVMEEDEGIDVSSVYNEKNKQCLSNGPFVYDLFSIMIHSGSASGGHYYAYIKDFKTGEWFCFNDQNVTKITYDDIRKTYGGNCSRGYYSSWTSSANAYMLMYRQADKEKNVDAISKDRFPDHVRELADRMANEEVAEREAREIERLMCRIKLFCQHPKNNLMVEKKLRVHKDITFKETTKLAYEELELESFVPLEQCRLVKYEEFHDSLECSFEGEENDAISEVLGGIRSSYKFDLLMEIREKNKRFEIYKPGGVTVKVFVVNLQTEEVEGPHTVRASQCMTVKEFKLLLGRYLTLDPVQMRIVFERYYIDLRPLADDEKTLKMEGFYRSNKVYIEASGVEQPNFFNGSQMYTILDRYENTINLFCSLPDTTPEALKELQIPPFKELDTPTTTPTVSTTSETVTTNVITTTTTEDDGTKSSTTTTNTNKNATLEEDRGKSSPTTPTSTEAVVVPPPTSSSPTTSSPTTSTKASSSLKAKGVKSTKPKVKSLAKEQPIPSDNPSTVTTTTTSTVSDTCDETNSKEIARSNENKSIKETSSVKKVKPKLDLTETKCNNSEPLNLVLDKKSLVDSCNKNDKVNNGETGNKKLELKDCSIKEKSIEISKDNKDISNGTSLSKFEEDTDSNCTKTDQTTTSSSSSSSSSSSNKTASSSLTKGDTTTKDSLTNNKEQPPIKELTIMDKLALKANAPSNKLGFNTIKFNPPEKMPQLRPISNRQSGPVRVKMPTKKTVKTVPPLIPPTSTSEQSSTTSCTSSLSSSEAIITNQSTESKVNNSINSTSLTTTTTSSSLTRISTSVTDTVSISVPSTSSSSSLLPSSSSLSSSLSSLSSSSSSLSSSCNINVVSSSTISSKSQQSTSSSTAGASSITTTAAISTNVSTTASNIGGTSLSSSCSIMSSTPVSSSSSSVCGGLSSSTSNTNLSDVDDEGIVDMESTTGSSNVNSDQSASEDSSLTSDSDRTLVGDPPEDKLSDTSDSPDYHNVSSPEDNPKDTVEEEQDWMTSSKRGDSWDDQANRQAAIRRYFRAQNTIDEETKQAVLKVSVDKRITVGQLKSQMQKWIGVSQEHFKLFKIFANSQEFECTRMTETLTTYSDNARLTIRLGRALLPGEHRGKLYLLQADNPEEPAKFLLDWVVRAKDTLGSVKCAIVKEINNRCKMDLVTDKVRLRKKSWKNPQTIYLDHYVLDVDLNLHPNWELYVQVLEGTEAKTGCIEELSIFIKWWHPSSHTTSPLKEVIIKPATCEALKHKISELTKMPIENIEFAKGKTSFPCDMSVLDIENDLDWTPRDGLLDQRPLYILDDGAVIYYKDNTETIKELSAAERSTLASAENRRLNRELQFTYSSTITPTYRSREKGLKIYLNKD